LLSTRLGAMLDHPWPFCGPAGPIKRPEKAVNPRAGRDIAEHRPIGWRHMPKWAHERLDRAKMPRQDLATCPRPDAELRRK
jgi:hypothetical protein